MAPFRKFRRSTTGKSGAIPIGYDIVPPFLSLELTGGSRGAQIRVTPFGQPTPLQARTLSMQLNDFTDDYRRVTEACAKAGFMLEGSLMASVAAVGYSLFSKLFTKAEQEIIQSKIEEVVTYETNDPMQFITGEYIPEKIAVVTQGIYVPWEFLYPEPLENSEDVDPRKFLGYSFYIQQDVTMAENRYYLNRPFSNEAGITVFVEDKLKVARDFEGPGVIDMFKKHGAVSSLHQPLDGKSRSIGNLGKALNLIDSDIIHFACHAELDRSGEVNIFVRNGHIEPVIDLMNNLESSRASSFVFMNACRLAITDSTRLSGLIQGLLAKNFSAVIATEIRIDDQKAWDFARLVYLYFLQMPCRSLQKALFFARRAQLREEGSMVGFTYRFYGTLDLVVR